MKSHRNLSKLALGCAFLAALLAVVVVPQAPVAAQRGGRVRAQIHLTQQRVPGNLTERSLIAWGRRSGNRLLQETTAEPINQRRWLANMILQFNQPPGDLEFHVLFYDVEDGPRRFVEDMSTFVNDRTQRTYVQPIRLPRPRFRPNRRYELVVTVRRAEVGSKQFGLVGEEVRRSGEVSFTADETR
jgi:hypothetical protein